MSAGFALLAAGLLLRLWAVRALLRAGLTQHDILEIRAPEAYTTAGPYRWLDHPAYAGSLLIIAGVGVLALGPPGAVLALASWPFFAARIHAENRLRGRGWL